MSHKKKKNAAQVFFYAHWNLSMTPNYQTSFKEKLMIARFRFRYTFFFIFKIL